MNEVVAIMTGAAEPGAAGHDQVVKQAGREDAAHAAETVRTTRTE
jgi:hypothetical protein